MDDRAVSTVVGYILAISITAALISILMLSTGGFIEQQQKSLIRAEGSVIQEQLAAKLASNDRRLRAQDGTNPYSTQRMDLPDKLAGNSYTLKIFDFNTSDNIYTIRIRTIDPQISYEVQFRSKTQVIQTTMSGGGSIKIDAKDTDGDGAVEQVLVKDEE